jgi:hypothetical protein
MTALPRLSLEDGGHRLQWPSSTTDAPTSILRFSASAHLADRWNPTAALANTTTTAAAAPSTHTIETLECRLQRRDAEMMERIVRHAEDRARTRTESLIEQHLNSIWQQERDQVLSHMVGTRSMGSVGHRHPLLASQGANPFPQLMASPAASMMQHAKASVNPSSRLLNETLDPAVVQAHLQILSHTDRSDPVQLARAYASMAQSLSSGSPAQAGYVEAWKHLTILLETRAHTSSEQARSTLVYLCHQLRHHMVDRVHQASSAGQDIATEGFSPSLRSNHMSTLASYCLSYIKVALGWVGAQAVWPALYCCLRCGDAVATLELWQQAQLSVASNTSSVVHRVLSHLAQRQQQSQCVWEVGVPSRIDPQDSKFLSDLSDAAAHGEHSDIYKVGFYALLSGVLALPQSDSAFGMATMEDYITSALWRALMSDNPHESIQDLGNVVESWDPEYLQDSNTGGWALALPLFMTQRYAKALEHLANVGGSTGCIQAVHLGMVMAMGQFALDVEQTQRLHDIVTSLLLTYASLLVSQVNAAAALEYTVYVPSAQQARKEVAALLARTGAIEPLAGTIDANGIRHNKALLDKYFSPEDISLILIETGDMLTHSSDTTQATISSAALCYFLAGKYSRVVALLNRQLCPPDVLNEGRQYWLQQTESFLTQFIDRRSHVLEVLERQEETSLVHTSRVLIQLHAFFDKMRQRHYDQAWSIVQSLQLFPTSSADMALQETSFHQLDPLLQQAFPAILSSAMEALYHQYQTCKSEHVQGSAATVARQRLREWQTSARLLSTFAGVVQLSGPQMQSLERYESLMI